MTKKRKKKIKKLLIINWLLPNKENNFSNDFIDELNIGIYDLAAFSENYEKLLDRVKKDKNLYYLQINEKLNIHLSLGIGPLLEWWNFLKNNYKEWKFFIFLI